MTLTPEQLEEAKQLLGVPDDPVAPSEPVVESEPVATDTVTTPVDPVPAASDNSLSVYCPNCSHLLAKVSNDAN